MPAHSNTVSVWQRRGKSFYAYLFVVLSDDLLCSQGLCVHCWVQWDRGCWTGHTSLVRCTTRRSPRRWLTLQQPPFSSWYHEHLQLQVTTIENTLSRHRCMFVLKQVSHEWKKNKVWEVTVVTVVNLWLSGVSWIRNGSLNDSLKKAQTHSLIFPSLPTGFGMY